MSKLLEEVKSAADKAVRTAARLAQTVKLANAKPSVQLFGNEHKYGTNAVPTRKAVLKAASFPVAKNANIKSARPASGAKAKNAVGDLIIKDGDTEIKARSIKGLIELYKKSKLKGKRVTVYSGDITHKAGWIKGDDYEIK